ncbi:MAG: prepilin-type N-terminal cleavage/methylation domain-containing protein, partial [Planctomycetes bacterium]|nr:prepilin-type N-terminal cleavage/methylation domain-containing protein [Planctomycetota bacterium]
MGQGCRARAVYAPVRKRKKNESIYMERKKGFTLIELLVVISIIAML